MKKNASYLFAITALFLASFINAGCEKQLPDNDPDPDTLSQQTDTLFPTALFSYTVDHLTVSFTNESENYDLLRWDFGDGSALSQLPNPTHDYITGSFEVSLIVSNYEKQADTLRQTITVARFEDETPDPDFTIFNPYKNYPNWYRGQMHVHTNFVPHDDGENTAEEMVMAYKKHGYDFIAVTGHDTSALDPGVEGILFIQGEELSGGLNGKYVHANLFNISETYPEGTEVSAMLQLPDALIQINHPSRNNIKQQDIDGLEGLFAIEIANYYNKTRLDMLLWNSQISEGKRIWCNAGDDMHDSASAGQNSTWVNSPDLSLTSILQNLKEGNFYISEGGTDGPDMVLSVEGKTITCTTTKGTQINWYKYDLIPVASSTETVSTYTPVGNEVFVRVEVVNDEGKTAYSQPFFLLYD